MEQPVKTSILARIIGSGVAADPRFTGIIAYDKDGNCAEIIAESPQIPQLAASIVLASQSSLPKIPQDALRAGWSDIAAAALQYSPLAHDLALSPDGRTLAVNVGTGVMYFRLAEPVAELLKTGLPVRRFDAFPWR